MMNITGRYGTREITREFDHGSTVADFLRHQDVALVLNLPENYSILVDGRTVERDYELSDGDVITFEKNATQKAA